MKTKVALALFRSVGRLPLGVVRCLGSALGCAMWLSKSREARITLANIQHCMPESSESEQRSLARRSVIEFGKTCFEIPLVLQRPPEWVAKKVKQVHNQALLDRALTDERGILLVTPHLGNWEVIGTVIGQQTHMTAMYEPARYPEFDAILKNSRSRLGGDMVPTDKRGVMALIKKLRAGGTSCVLPDQEPDLTSGEFAPFFGRRALTMTLLNKLLQRSGAQAIVHFILRVPGGFDVYYMEPDPAIYSAEQSEALAALNRSIEAAVKRAPQQYQWEYKRFKQCPEGKPSIY
ncbi:lysophospholipid acyltransferase family protein [Porticoccus sp. GXU_MW_L64]